MLRNDHARFDIGHPAPDRDRISPWLLIFAVLGAPFAWSAQLSANAAIAGLRCLGPAGIAAAGGEGGEAPTLIVVNLVAAFVAAAALAVAVTGLRRTRGEEEQHSGGVMRAGEGRTRFLSVWGVWSGLLFLIAIAASTVSSFWSALCPG